jgi:hypothetical protein
MDYFIVLFITWDLVDAESDMGRGHNALGEKKCTV